MAAAQKLAQAEEIKRGICSVQFAALGAFLGKRNQRFVGNVFDIGSRRANLNALIAFANPIPEK